MDFRKVFFDNCNKNTNTGLDDSADDIPLLNDDDDDDSDDDVSTITKTTKNLIEGTNMDDLLHVKSGISDSIGTPRNRSTGQ